MNLIYNINFKLFLYSHLPENMWPTLNFVLPANFQELVVGQVLVLPVRMTVQVAPPEDGL